MYRSLQKKPQVPPGKATKKNVGGKNIIVRSSHFILNLSLIPADIIFIKELSSSLFSGLIYRVVNIIGHIYIYKVVNMISHI